MVKTIINFGGMAFGTSSLSVDSERSSGSERILAGEKLQMLVEEMMVDLHRCPHMDYCDSEKKHVLDACSFGGVDCLRAEQYSGFQSRGYELTNKEGELPERFK